MNSLVERVQGLLKRQVSGQLLRFGAVGLLNLGTHIALYNVFRSLGATTLASNIAGFLITSLQSYALNRTFSFKQKGRHPLLLSYMLFLVFTVVGLVIHTSTFKGLLLLSGKEGRVAETIALMLAVPLSALWNFFAYRTWTFNATSSAGGDRDVASAQSP